MLQAILQKKGGIAGNEFESLVIAEIYKQAKSILSNTRFYHYRTSEGAEVDLLVEIPNGYYAFEVKMSNKATRSDARQLFNLVSVLDKPLLHGFLLTNDKATVPLSDNVTAINVEYFLG